MHQVLVRSLVHLCFFAASLSSLFGQAGAIQFGQPLYTWSEADFITVSTTFNGTVTNTNYLTPGGVTVTRTGGSTGVVGVNYCFWVDETTNNAVEGANYQVADNTRQWVAAGTLTWADGESAPKTVPFSYQAFGETRYNLKPTSLVQGNVTYSGRLVTVIGGATLGATDTTRLEIIDAEAPAAGVINLTSRRFYGENGAGALVSLRRDGGTTGSVSVNYATSSTLPPLTSSSQQPIGTGIAGTHYTHTTGTLTWPDGDNSVKAFTIPLPATNYSNGTLHVAVNLTSPTNSSVLGTVSSALLTIQNKASTVFDINDNVDGSTYRVSLPSGPGPVRGVLFWWPGTNGDDRGVTTDPNFRKIADSWRFAIASPRFNYSPSPNRIEFSQPKLSFLFNRLAQIAKTTGRPEIVNAPFVHSGMSAGSFSSSTAIRIWPERTIAIVGQEGWTSTYSQNLGNYVSFDSLSKEIPCLALAGQNDSTVTPSGIHAALNEYRRGGVTRSAAMMCWGRPHTFSSAAPYHSVSLYWLDQVMAAGRYPADQGPTSSTAPVLGSLPLSSGWWGVRNSTNTANYTLPGGSSSFLNIGPDATFTGIKDVNNALVDSWLPTESAARAYRGFVSTPTMSFSSPAQSASGLTGNPVSLAISENGLGSGVTKVEFYDGTSKIDEDTTSPYSVSWIPSAPGARSLTAIAWKGATPTYTAFTLFIASAVVPPTPSGLSAIAASTSQIDLTWSDIPSNETGFKLERSANGANGWVQIATPGANAVSVSDTGLATAIPYFYRLRATNSAGDSGYSNIASATTLNGLQGFRAANGLAANGSEDLLTPAGDGVANLLKYAFNMVGEGTGQTATLSTPNSRVLTPSGAAGMPLVEMGSGANSGKLKITYIRRKAASSPGITYAVEFSDALGTWGVNASSVESVASIDAAFERVTITDSAATNGKRFVRVRVASIN